MSCSWFPSSHRRLTVPLANSKGIDLPYPIGVSDLFEIGGEAFAPETSRRVPQFVYMGAGDTNDAVAFDDGYSNDERAVVHAALGATMQPDRWEAVQALYRASRANVTFRTYQGIAHGTNEAINRDVGDFFHSVIRADAKLTLPHGFVVPHTIRRQPEDRAVPCDRTCTRLENSFWGTRGSSTESVLHFDSRVVRHRTWWRP
jgi:hypothetical protein